MLQIGSSNLGQLGGTPSIPLSINGTSAETLTGAFNLVATLDGTPGGTYNAATDTLAFTSTGGWVRPSFWPALPTLTAASEAGYILLQVYENRLNRFTCQIGNNAAIDWGDGSTSAPTFAIRTKTYTYSTLPGTVYVDALTGENYKFVTIGITASGGNIVHLDFTIAASTAPTIATNFAVDWNLSFPNATTLLMGGMYAREQLYAKQVKIWALGTLSFFRIAKLINCESLQLPASRSTGNWSGFLADTGPIRLADQNWGLATLITQVFGGRIISHGNLTANSATHASYYLANCESLQSIGTINLPIATVINYMISYCYVLQSCGLVNAPLAQDISFFATGSRSLVVLKFADCAAVTDTTQMINYCTNLQVLHLPNLTRGINFYSSAIGNYGMNIFASGDGVLNGVGTASGGQTITITSTPFGALVTAADATALAIRAVMIGKGYTIAN